MAKSFELESFAVIKWFWGGTLGVIDDFILRRLRGGG